VVLHRLEEGRLTWTTYTGGNILCPFALGFFVVFYYRKYRYQKRRAEAFKEKLGEYVKASVKLSHDLEICKARNSSLKQGPDPC
jgi:hypothetical protein